MPGHLPVLWTREQIDAATPAERALITADIRREVWRADPARYAWERLGIVLYSKQIELLESVRDNSHTASPAGFDLGKSFTAMVLVCWWIETSRPGEKVIVITTAPKGEQVDGIVWRELNIIHRAKKLVGRISTREWKINGTLVGRGTKPSDYSAADFQGYHADRALVILDEAAGVAEKFWEGADGITANEASRVLAIGNPEAASEKFGRVCDPNHKEGKKWKVVRISAFDSPNVTGENVPDVVKRNLVPLSWIERKREEWGEDSPMWISKVLAQFVRDIKQVVVPYSWAMKCAHRADDETDTEPIELGVDCGAGGDLSVIQERVGRRAGRQWDSQHDDPSQLVGEIMAAQAETGATSIKIDGIGIGWSVAGWVTEKLETAGIDCSVVVVDVRNSSNEPHKFANLRSEIWWEVGRELCRTQGWDLTDLLVNDDSELQERGEQTINELCEPKYRHDSSGRIRVEPKEDTIKRLSHSPDRADALLLAFYVPPPSGPSFLGTV